MIIYLPPEFDCDFLNYIPLTENELEKREPQVIITRIYKTTSNNSLIIYQIESIITSHQPTTSNTINNNNSIICVSSQANASEIRSIYRELNFVPIDEIFGAGRVVNVFGILLEMSLKLLPVAEPQKYAQIILFDFDINKTITIKLWRGLSVWISSLSIGCRLQIRNLQLNDKNELHSKSSTEIHLLVHGNSGKMTDVLSSRAYNLTAKEQDILQFLNHQSLLIYSQKLPKSSKFVTSPDLILSAPFYLEFKKEFWILEGVNGSLFNSVRFDYIDAKVWQQLNEIFMDSSGFSINLSGLKPIGEFAFEFTCDSFIKTEQSTSTVTEGYKCVIWDDLISSKIVLNGTYIIKGILSTFTNASNSMIKSEESLGNLSIIPEAVPLTVLMNPANSSTFIYLDNKNNLEDKFGEGDFIINIRTFLNDESNVNEIIRKSVNVL